MRTTRSQTRRITGAVIDMGQKVTVKVKVDLKKAGMSKITDDVKLFAVDDMFRLMSPYVPMESGTLFETVDRSPKGVLYKSIYARYQYNGVNFHFNHDPNKHPLATAKWDKAMLAAHGDKLMRDIQNYINRKGR